MAGLTLTAKILSRQHLTNSASGNPRFRLNLMDESGESAIVDTEADSACNYDVDNAFNEGGYWRFTLTPQGRIKGLSRTDGSAL